MLGDHSLGQRERLTSCSETNPTGRGSVVWVQISLSTSSF